MARKYNQPLRPGNIIDHIDTRSTFNELAVSDDGTITQKPLPAHSYSALEEHLVKTGELKPASLD